MATTPEKISEIFADDIEREIEEVIKVDALAENLLLNEIKEYHPTASIQEQMARVLDAYFSAHRAQTDRVGVWVSGFFGAGKSSFAKLLAILMEARKIGDSDAVDLFAERITRDDIKVLLHEIREHLPTHVVVFDILKDILAGGREHPVTVIIYKALLRSLGYPEDLDLAELEINLEQQGRLAEFEAKYEELYPGRTWGQAKKLVMTAVNEASTVLHHLEPSTYSSPDSWARSRPKAEIAPRKLAERTLELAKARADGRNVVFVVDEMGQYTARELDRILDLHGVIESFAIYGRGKIWLIATAQEKLEQVVDIWKESRSELARLQDRFAYKVFLEPSDIREVASHRVLSKSAAAEALLREQFARHRGKLAQATKVSGTIQLPALEEDAFIQLYPLLPYQVDLFMLAISGLRSHGGVSQTMGGGTRTIVKLAQQLIVHEKVGIGTEPIGRLATFDNVYELVSTNVSSEVKQEIDEIERQVDDPCAAPVAKALSLLQFAQAIYTSEENLAAVLHPAVQADTVSPEVRTAVDELIQARKVRRVEHGLKIQSAAERTWDEERDSRRPTAGDRSRILKEVLEQIWGKGAQAPSHRLGGWKPFSAGLKVRSERIVDGDVMFEVRLSESPRPAGEEVEEARKATQQDDSLLTWLIGVSEEGERAVVERYRSDRMISRGTRSKEEEPLLRDEGHRKRAADQTLKDELGRALCCGRIFFRGNDRSPGDDTTDARAVARQVLVPALEAIFYRFEDGNTQVTAKDMQAILTNESLAGLPECYTDLGLVRTVEGQVRLITDHGAASEILEWIKLQCDSRQAASGKELEHNFTSAPYGWHFELIRLIVATLLRAGQITLTVQGRQFKNALTPEVRKEISDNRRFRAVTIRGREVFDHQKLIAAGRLLQERFGHSPPALTVESIAHVLRGELCRELPRLESSREVLRELSLPGDTVLGQGLDALRTIDRSDDEEAVLAFLDTADTLAKAIPRARTMEEELTEPVRVELQRARTAAWQVGPVVRQEVEESDPVIEALTKLEDHLAKETFFEELASIRAKADAVIERYGSLYNEAFREYQEIYSQALNDLYRTPGWQQLNDEIQTQIAKELRERAEWQPPAELWRDAGLALSLLREQTRSAVGYLSTAEAEVRHAISPPDAVEIRVSSVVSGLVASPEELETALALIRQAIERVLADGHPVVLL